MNYHFATLLLSLCLFTLSVNRAAACGNDDHEHAARFHEEKPGESCGDTFAEQPGCCTDTEHAPQNQQSDCPCDHENSGCHCPGCQLVVHAGAGFTLETPPALAAHVLNFPVQKQAFYFAAHLPEAVYLPIWQPPKI